MDSKVKSLIRSYFKLGKKKMQPCELFQQVLRDDFGNSSQKVGGCNDREFCIVFDFEDKRFQLLFEFPLLPCLLVYDLATENRLDDQCINLTSSTDLRITAKEYYSQIEKMPDSELEKLRCSEFFDRWFGVVIAEYVRLLRQRLQSNK